MKIEVAGNIFVQLPSEEKSEIALMIDELGAKYTLATKSPHMSLVEFDCDALTQAEQDSFTTFCTDKLYRVIITA